MGHDKFSVAGMGGRSVIITLVIIFPPSNPLTSNLLADTTLPRTYHCHTLPCTNSVVWQLAFSLDWPLKMGPICCPGSLVRNYHYLLH